MFCALTSSLPFWERLRVGELAREWRLGEAFTILAPRTSKNSGSEAPLFLWLGVRGLIIERNLL